MNKCIFLLLIAFASSCKTILSGDRICYKNAKTIQRISWSEGILGHSHLILKKGNYFDYYQAMQLFIDTKIEKTEYHGTYTELNDTLFFKFCGDTIPKLLTQKAFINKSKNEIVLLAPNPKLNHRFAIRFDKH